MKFRLYVKRGVKLNERLTQEIVEVGIDFKLIHIGW